MQLVISTFGSYLRKQGEDFIVRNEDKVFQVAARRVRLRKRPRNREFLWALPE